MPNNINMNEFAIKLGISADKLGRNMAVYEAASELFPKLELAECKVGLFGGTALNKIYFGKRQRLSYDLDLFAYSYKRALKALADIGARIKYTGTFPGKKVVSTRMTYKEVVLDIVDAKAALEEPRKLQLIDLLYYFGQLVPPIVVPSYSIEYLMAEKTMAMSDRNELKDIYDTWAGIKLLKVPDTYLNYLKRIAKDGGVKDVIGHLKHQLANMLANAEYYDKKRVEILDQPNPRIMLREIEAFLDRL